MLCDSYSYLKKKFPWNLHFPLSLPTALRVKRKFPDLSTKTIYNKALYRRWWGLVNVLNDRKGTTRNWLGQGLCFTINTIMWRCMASPLRYLCPHLPFRKRSCSLAFIEIFLRIIAGAWLLCWKCLFCSDIRVMQEGRAPASLDIDLALFLTKQVLSPKHTRACTCVCLHAPQPFLSSCKRFH